MAERKKKLGKKLALKKQIVRKLSGEALRDARGGNLPPTITCDTKVITAKLSAVC